jgi:tRNA-binding EMAP/Myf-like protein
VGRVLEAAPVPNSEKLLQCKIDVGGGEVRQVVAGLQQYVEAAALAGAAVVTITNLKPAKLAGIPSEAMILAADATVGDLLLVKTLAPPGGCGRRPPLRAASPLRSGPDAGAGPGAAPPPERAPRPPPSLPRAAAGSEAGDAVYLEGGAPSEGHPKICKSDDWRSIVARLSVQAQRPCFEGRAFVTARGVVTLPAEMPDGSGIH